MNNLTNHFKTKKGIYDLETYNNYCEIIIERFIDSFRVGKELKPMDEELIKQVFNSSFNGSFLTANGESLLERYVLRLERLAQKIWGKELDCSEC